MKNFQSKRLLNEEIRKCIHIFRTAKCYNITSHYYNEIKNLISQRQLLVLKTKSFNNNK